MKSAAESRHAGRTAASPVARVGGSAGADRRFRTPSVHAAAPIWVSDGSAAAPGGVDPAEVRRAIRQRRKLRIAYSDASGRESGRVVWPVAMAHYVDATLVATWCELRADLRHFRVERIAASEVLDERYPDDRGRLLAAWLAPEWDRPQAGPQR